jgi:hypothetical protein
MRAAEGFMALGGFQEAVGLIDIGIALDSPNRSEVHRAAGLYPDWKMGSTEHIWRPDEVRRPPLLRLSQATGTVLAITATQPRMLTSCTGVSVAIEPSP